MIRNYQSPAVVIAAGQSLSNPFVIRDYAWGSFQLGSLNGTAVTFHVSNDGTNFAPLNDATGTALVPVNVAAGQITPFPDELFYHAYAQIVSNANESQNVPVVVFLKS